MGTPYEIETKGKILLHRGRRRGALPHRPDDPAARPRRKARRGRGHRLGHLHGLRAPTNSSFELTLSMSEVLDDMLGKLGKSRPWPGSSSATRGRRRRSRSASRRSSTRRRRRSRSSRRRRRRPEAYRRSSPRSSQETGSSRGSRCVKTCAPGQLLAHGGLDLFGEVVAALDRPGPGHEHVHRDEAPGARRCASGSRGRGCPAPGTGRAPR